MTSHSSSLLFITVFLRMFYTLFSSPCSTKPVEKPKELIIPLIQKNRWKTNEGVKQKDGKEAPSDQQDSVESQAIKELIEGFFSYYYTLNKSLLKVIHLTV